MSNNMGRWHSPDPIAGSVTDPQSWNMYSYARNIPTSLVNGAGTDCVYMDDSFDEIVGVNQEEMQQSNCLNNSDFRAEGTVTDFSVDQQGDYV